MPLGGRAVHAPGLKLCAEEPKWYSDTVSATVVPEGFNARDVIATASRKYNISWGAGLNEVAGKVFRTGHLGGLNSVSCLGAIAGTEITLLDNRFDIGPGRGVGEALEYCE